MLPSKSHELQQFNFTEAKTVQSLLIDSQPWFVAKDVCAALELADTETALRKLDEDEKLTRKLYVSGQQREVYLVNESGLYNLIFRSNKAEARAFRKWVTAVVLPQLRTTGQYGTPKSPVDVRHLVFAWVPFHGREVRSLTLDGQQWYEITGYCTSINLYTCAYQLAEKLNKITPMARKLWLFGMNSAGWFTTQQGLNLITVGTRKHKAVLQASLPFPEAANQLQGGAK